MEFRHTQLDNGLNIVTEVNPAAASMAAGFFVQTGSRDETPEISGVSHFLEHMMFKGTPRRSPFDVNREFDEMGANYNAFTSEENTVYYGAVLPEFQTRLLDLLGDILRPALREEDFEIEKNVIIDEIALYEDMPRFRVYDRLMSEFFAGHPLGNSILGTRESIRALKASQMREYFERRYSAGNITLVGVGNLDFDAFVEKAEQMCGHWQHYDISRDRPGNPGHTHSVVLTDPKVTREQIGMMSPAPSMQDHERYAGDLLSCIVGDDTGSRFYYELVEPAITDEAELSYSAMDGAGGFLTFLSCDKKRAAEAQRIARNVLAKFVEEGPTEEEMTAAKNKIATSGTLKGELPMGRLTSVGFDWLYRQEYVPLKEQIEILFGVTRDEVHALAKRCDLRQTASVALGPLKKL